jgi:Flp pilus assembly protein TadB
MFADALARLVKEGKPLPAAIGIAAKECGITPTIKDIQKAVWAHPHLFPPAYKRLR